MSIDSSIINILGEVLWHSNTIDRTIDEVSIQHFESIKGVLAKHGIRSLQSDRKLRILEVAAYAHTTGYRLAQTFNAEVVLMDISPDTLALGARIAAQQQFDTFAVRRIAGDFHDLPFFDGQFDFVYIASALHHTWQWETVLSEMLRVLAPEGILFLENEPCLREFCFYKFRTSRPKNFRPFEKALDETGLIRTIAEPFLGSRPEQLFGMVENQTIPLESFLCILDESGKIVELQLVPEHNMGDLEKHLIEIRHNGFEFVKSFLTEYLKAGVEYLCTYLTNDDIALGSTLPKSSEIADMASKVAAHICAIKEPLSSISARIEISRLFGAAVKVVVRKKWSEASVNKELSLRFDMGRLNGVTLSYPPNVAQILDGVRDLLPDIQTSEDVSLRKVFPERDWHIIRSGNSLTSLSHIRNSAEITCPRVNPDAEAILILLRMSASYTGKPYKITVRVDDVAVSTFDVFQTEAFIMKAQVAAEASAVSLRIEMSDILTGKMLETNPGISLASGRIIELCTKKLPKFHTHNDPQPISEPTQMHFSGTGESTINSATDSSQIRENEYYLPNRMIKNMGEHRSYVTAMKHEYDYRLTVEFDLLSTGEPFHMGGYCCVCKRQVYFHVNYAYGCIINGKQYPNWRESIVCEECHLNNRTRGFVHVFEQLAQPDSSAKIYIAEQLSPLYQHLAKKYPLLIGSEYIGNGDARFVERAGQWVQHQDLTSLSFEDNLFDIIMHQDVLEHIPDYFAALREGYRILKPSGYFFFTVPFVISSSENIIRSRILSDGGIEHLLPPEYHGNPLDDEGCLAFYHFGWELLEQLKTVGFKEPVAVFYWSREYGYLGGDQFLFMARK